LHCTVHGKLDKQTNNENNAINCACSLLTAELTACNHIQITAEDLSFESNV